MGGTQEEGSQFLWPLSSSSHPRPSRICARLTPGIEEQRAGLGEDFLSSIDACIKRIRRNPDIYEIVHESYRRALVRRFPYAVFFDYSDDTVTTYCIFQTARDPEKWRRRLR